MRRIRIFIVCVLALLVSCSHQEELQDKGQETNLSAFELGMEALENENVEEAKRQFERVIEGSGDDEEEGDDYLALIESTELVTQYVKEEAYDDAIETIQIIKEDEKFSEVQFILSDEEDTINEIIAARVKIDEKIEGLAEYYNPDDSEMAPSELYLVKSEEILDEPYLSKNQEDEVKAFQQAAKKRTAEIMAGMEKEHQEAEAPPKNIATPLSQEDAREVVYHFVVSNGIVEENLLQQEEVLLEYDHDTETGEYVFQMYHIVELDEDSAHTSTWGWYEVDPETAEVRSQ